MIWLQSLATAAGIVVVFATLRDAFETIVLPRRPSGRARMTVLFHQVAWRSTRAAALRMKPGERRERVLSYYGPLWMISLVATWALVIMLAFALIQWGIGSDTQSNLGHQGFWNDFYISGTTLFTLGMGDIFPSSAAGRVLAVIEAGLGLGFLALVIGYLPVLYTSFSRREVLISLFDARAGSPPSAGELLRRFSAHKEAALLSTLDEFEHWAAELLESHLSYPVLGYYRSQHDRQSWLGAITTILDASAVLIASEDDRFYTQAKLTFAMARHTVIDLAQIFGTRPAEDEADRLLPGACHNLMSSLRDAGLGLPPGFEEKLNVLRVTYEPAVIGMARHLVLDLPGWLPEAGARDDWETSLAVLGE